MSLRGLPRRQKFGAVTVKVSALPADLEERFGDYSAGTERIRIDPRLTPGRTAVVFLHEALHAMVAVGGIAFANTKAEESVVEPLALALAAWMRENPGTVRWLSAQLAAE